LYTSCRLISVFTEQPTNVFKCGEDNIDINVKDEIIPVIGREGP
jgi:hypothetical protein